MREEENPLDKEEDYIRIENVITQSGHKKDN